MIQVPAPRQFLAHRLPQAPRRFDEKPEVKALGNLSSKASISDLKQGNRTEAPNPNRATPYQTNMSTMTKTKWIKMASICK